MMLWIAKFYSLLYRVVQDTLHYNIRGIGFIVSRLNHDAVLLVHGKKYYFNHVLSSCYLRMLSGDYNEPETHHFVSFLADRAVAKLTVLDIGANIGEMVIDFSGHPRIERVVAFEPSADCVSTIAKSIELNARNNVTIVQKAVSNSVGTATFYVKVQSVVSSSLLNPDLTHSAVVATTTIDAECETLNSPAIMLIDVEGSELLVLNGAKNFIQKNRPLIIFEYNILGRQHYSLDDIKNELGDGYELFRLRRDGFLDTDLTNTWNCVAVHASSWAHTPCMGRKR